MGAVLNAARRWLEHQQLLQMLSIKNDSETRWRSWDLSHVTAVKNCYRPRGWRGTLPQNDSAVGSPTAFPSPPDAGLLQRRPLVSRQNCMSIVSNSIINADAEARYLSPGELDQ
ncbi:MAG: hypothetical protein ACK46L_07515, partial [Synechococcaceae cyanobacterium]